MKRLSTSDPLTADDVAERLDKAAERVLHILMDTRQQEGDLYEQVRGSRYLKGALELLAGELAVWEVTPKRWEDLPRVREPRSP